MSNVSGFGIVGSRQKAIYDCTYRKQSFTMIPNRADAMQYGEMPIAYAELFNKVGIGSYPNFIIPHRKQNIRNIQPYQPPIQWKWYNA